jgi:hypothetical protein
MSKIKAGFQGKEDSMRNMAEKLMGTSKCKKYAMGGVAKIRHGESTKSGMPKKVRSSSYKNNM